MRITLTFLLGVFVVASSRSDGRPDAPPPAAKAVGKREPALDGWNNYVVSPDGTRIAAERRRFERDPLGPLYKEVPYGVRVWAVDGLRPICTTPELPADSGYLSGLTFSADGSRVATFDSKCRLHVWDATTGAAVSSRTFVGTHCFLLQLSPDGKRVTAFGRTSEKSGRTVEWFRCWHAETGELRFEIVGRDSRTPSETGLKLQFLRVSRDGRTLFAPSEKGIHQYDALTGKETGLIAAVPPPGLIRLVGNGPVLARWDGGKTCRFLDPLSQKELGVAGGYVHDPVLSPDGAYLYWVADGLDGGSLVRWDITRGKQVSATPVAKGTSDAGVISPDGKYLRQRYGVGTQTGMSGTRPLKAGTVVRRADTGAELLSLTTYTGPNIVGAGARYSDAYNREVVFLPGDRLLTVTETGRAKVWSLARP